MNDVEKKVLDIISRNRDDAIDFLRQIVSVDSTIVNQGERGYEGRVQPIVAERLKKLGCDVDVFEPDNERLSKYTVDFNKGRHYENRPNVVGKLKGTGNGRSLILSGHIDTVPYFDQQWTFPPLGGVVHGGKMYGRGTIDMKAGLAAMIKAVEAIKEAGVELAGDLIIESVVDEEGGGNGTLACVDRGYLADAAIITEGSGEQVIVANRGVLNVSITIKGVAAHAANKWTGVNAIEKMMKIIAGLGELERTWLATKTHSLLPSPTITVGEIQGGIGATVVPDNCVIKCDVKFLPHDIEQDGSARRIKKEFEDWVQLNASGDEWLRDNRPVIKWYSEVMPYELEPDHPLVLNAVACAEEIQGLTKIAGMAGGSDARIMQNVGKVPTILYGPKGEAGHGADENVDLASYIRTNQALALMTIRWCR